MATEMCEFDRDFAAAKLVMRAATSIAEDQGIPDTAMIAAAAMLLAELIGHRGYDGDQVFARALQGHLKVVEIAAWRHRNGHCDGRAAH